MVDKAVYADQEERREAQARKVRPFAWAGLVANLAALALILNGFVTNIAVVGERSESFIATTVTMILLLITVATILGWVQWFRKKGSTDGLAVLWITTIILIGVALSPAMEPDFYMVELEG